MVLKKRSFFGSLPLLVPMVVTVKVLLFATYRQVIMPGGKAKWNDKCLEQADDNGGIAGQRCKSVKGKMNMLIVHDVLENSLSTNNIVSPSNTNRSQLQGLIKTLKLKYWFQRRMQV